MSTAINYCCDSKLNSGISVSVVVGAMMILHALLQFLCHKFLVYSKEIIVRPHECANPCFAFIELVGECGDCFGFRRKVGVHA